MQRSARSQTAPCTSTLNGIRCRIVGQPSLRNPPAARVGDKIADSSQAEAVWQQLTALEAVRRQQTAFTCATGLPLTLLPASTPGATIEAMRAKGAFCVKGCMGEQSGVLCQRMLSGAERRAAKESEAVRFRCPSGLIKILVPVIIGGRHAGNLLVGPFSLRSLHAGTLRRLTKQLAKWGLHGQADRLRASWRYSAVITTEKVRAVSTLTDMFAQYLAESGNRLLLREAGRKSPLLQKIDAYLAEHQQDPISMKAMAERVHFSPCYFCKLFKKQTGLTFTEYRTRTRIEKAKQLLQNHQLRVSEAAFEAGFNSIPYFNRAFHHHVGCSPSQYRVQTGRINQAKKRIIQA